MTAVAVVAAVALLTVGGASGAATGAEEPAKPDCRGYKPLAAKAYAIEQWWQTADPSPVTRQEGRRLRGFVREGCAPAVRRKAKERYGRFYRKEIAPERCNGERFVRCDVALCESSYGTAPDRNRAFTYGLTVYWHAIGPLPRWGNHTRTGHRFAPSEPASTHIENNVFAWAAFKFGPTPSTCAS